MSNVSGVGGNNFINFGNQPTNNVGNTNSTNSTNNNSFGLDGFNSNMQLNSVSNLIYSIDQIVTEDSKLAGRFDTWFMGDSEKFLRVGSTSVGKFFINLISGNVPLFTNSATSLQISSSVDLWVSRSDLVRSGANPFQSSLLQELNIMNVTDLSLIQHPADQANLANLMNQKAMERGVPMTVDAGTVSSWVSTSTSLKKYL